MMSGAGTYVVAKDDTLLGIARKTGVSFSTLARINNLQAPYVVKVGQRLKMPASTGETEVAAAAGASSVASSAAGPIPVAPGVTTQPLAPPPPAPTAGRSTEKYASLAEREKAAPAPPPAPPPASSAAPPSAPGAAAVPSASPSYQTTPPPAPPGQPSTGGSAAGAAAPVAAASAVAAAPAAETDSAVPAEQKLAAVTPPPPPPGNGKGYVWPVHGTLLSEFGTTGRGQHNDGINIAVPKGTPVLAAQDGVVAYSGNELRGFGNLLLVKHADGWMTAYAHNDTLLVKRGDTVRRGQQIAKSGDSGGVAQPQLHFEVRHGTRAVDPMTFLGGKAAPAASAIDAPEPG
jgi:murein DD-endopeptidase MepM/ murein hydrolase activator NlpD